MKRVMSDKLLVWNLGWVGRRGDILSKALKDGQAFYRKIKGEDFPD